MKNITVVCNVIVGEEQTKVMKLPKSATAFNCIRTKYYFREFFS